MMFMGNAASFSESFWLVIYTVFVGVVSSVIVHHLKWYSRSSSKHCDRRVSSNHQPQTDSSLVHKTKVAPKKDTDSVAPSSLQADGETECLPVQDAECTRSCLSQNEHEEPGLKNYAAHPTSARQQEDNKVDNEEADAHDTSIQEEGCDDIDNSSSSERDDQKLPEIDSNPCEAHTDVIDDMKIDLKEDADDAGVNDETASERSVQSNMTQAGGLDNPICVPTDYGSDDAASATSAHHDGVEAAACGHANNDNNAEEQEEINETNNIAPSKAKTECTNISYAGQMVTAPSSNIEQLKEHGEEDPSAYGAVAHGPTNIVNIGHADHLHLHVNNSDYRRQNANKSCNEKDFYSSFQVDADNFPPPYENVDETLEASNVGAGSHPPIFQVGSFASDQPPAYHSSMSEGKSTDYGSLEVRIDGTHYSLLTNAAAYDSDSEDDEIPEEIIETVTKICKEEHVTSVNLYPSPDDPKELLVVGVGAGKAEEKLKAAIQSQHPGFTIFTDTIADYTQHRREFSVLQTIKEFYDAEKQVHMEHGRATCGLILEGDNCANVHNDVGYYAFVPAHFPLAQADMLRLNEENAPEEMPRYVQENTAGRLPNSRFALEMFYPKKLLTLQLNHMMYRYRHYQHGEYRGEDHFSSFMTDAVLLEINKSDFYIRNNPNIISFEELKSSMSQTSDGNDIKDVFPLKFSRLLKKMGHRRVRVQVGPSRGYMISSGVALAVDDDDPNDRPQILHIQFIIEDWPLLPGHSGTIMYVIDSKNGHRYPLGQLIGSCRRSHVKNRTIYQAIVLRTAIDELEDVYKHKVKNLKPLGCIIANASGTSLSVKDLKQLGPAHPAKASTVNIARNRNADDSGTWSALNSNLDLDRSLDSQLSLGSFSSRPDRSHIAEDLPASIVRPETIPPLSFRTSSEESGYYTASRTGKSSDSNNNGFPYPPPKPDDAI